MTDLGSPAGGSTTAASVNDSGEIVGASYTTSGTLNAYLYSNGTMKEIGVTGYAAGINDAGQVVGGMSFAPIGHAFLWSAAAGVTDLGAGPAPYNYGCSASTINDSGQIVGTAYSPPLPNGTGDYPHAFVYTNGTMQDLNNLTCSPGFTLNTATAINASGQIVGSAQVNGVSPTVDVPYLLTPLEPGDANGDGRVDVNDLTIVLTNFGRTGEKWSQGDFNGNGTVNVNDLTIVLSNYGYGVSAGPGPHSVPEPSSLALLLAAAALAPLAFRRRQRNPHTPCAESDVGYG